MSAVEIGGFLGGKESACQSRRNKRCGFDPWVGKSPLEKEMATCSSILAWQISWIEEPDGLQSMRLKKRHDWARARARAHTHTHTHTHTEISSMTLFVLYVWKQSSRKLFYVPQRIDCGHLVGKLWSMDSPLSKSKAERMLAGKVAISYLQCYNQSRMSLSP